MNLKSTFAALLLTGFVLPCAAKGKAPTSCPQKSGAQKLTMREYFDYVSQVARRQHRCVYAAYNQSSVVYVFDRSGNLLDDYSRPLYGCSGIRCDIVDPEFQ